MLNSPKKNRDVAMLCPARKSSMGGTLYFRGRGFVTWRTACGYKSFYCERKNRKQLARPRATGLLIAQRMFTTIDKSYCASSLFR